MTNAVFNIYLCGGVGIKVGNLFSAVSRQSRHVDQIVALDSSNANKAVDDCFPIERLEGAEGSGSDKRANMHLYKPFVKQVLSKYPPNKLNIVVFTGSGGTGSGIGPHVMREFLEAGIPALAMVIGDDSSMKELDNTVSTLRSLAAQTKLGVPVCFTYHLNRPELTHSAVNQQVVQSIDSALLALNLDNVSIDYADISNLFFFSRVVNADPILTQMTFLTDTDLDKYDRQPIAAISVFAKEDDMRAPFPGLMYRKAGTFSEANAGFEESCHVVLDHGSTLAELETMMESHKKRTDGIGSRFKVQKSAIMDGADDDGMFC
ncbi:putative tubulin-like protein [Aeromonas phage D6]|uniref:Tubulin-like protein n=1 Tax=Aeromonas phage D6 TaxID=2593322 RepID=A0A514TVY6_9CAUD|nr:tubulin PhuZ [Aeromonas phage D6]QDJ97195.1 putative tubulin-like protein [Aeromonas phage D6]